jgi:ribose transport system permease protein
MIPVMPRSIIPSILLVVIYLVLGLLVYVGYCMDSQFESQYFSLGGWLVGIGLLIGLIVKLRDQLRHPNTTLKPWLSHRATEKLISTLGPLVVLGLVSALFAIADALQGFAGNFWSISSFRLIMIQTAVVAVAALGMTLIIVSGGIDLSSGTALALSGVILGLGLKAECGFQVAAVCCILCGTICGTLNGALISLMKLPPFIITLGTMTIFLGIAKMIATDGGTVKPPPGSIPNWVSDMVTLFPDPTWIAYPLLPNLAWGVWAVLGLAIMVAAILQRTIFGRHVFAIGSNESTARLCGIPISLTKIAIYTLAGFLIGIGGVFQFARLSQGDATSGIGLELRIIAAVVIGGASLNGGRGSVLGTLCGAAIMSVIKQGCSALGLANQLEDILLGAIIIAAVAVDQWRVRAQNSMGTQQLKS